MLKAALCFAAVIATSAKISCIGEKGTPVDYFYQMKAPNGNDTYYTEGAATLKQTDNGMGHSKGGIPWTLDQLYGKLPKTHLYAVYNDQTPDDKSSAARAHSKGVIVFDGESGFWLIHSLPRYPDYRDDGYGGLPDSKYGQSFVCLTLGIDQLEKIGEQLQVMWPQYYNSEMSDKLAKQYPVFGAALIDVKSKKTQNIQEFTTLGGKKFTHIAKSKQCECELYQDIVAPTLGSDIKVETWMNGAIDNRILTSCKSDGFKYNVEDMDNITTTDGRSWTETQDHSKWAIQSSGSLDQVCVGDINRQYSQSKRGGGTMCVQDKKLWTAFNEIVGSIDGPCKK